MLGKSILNISKEIAISKSTAYLKDVHYKAIISAFSFVSVLLTLDFFLSIGFISSFPHLVLTLFSGILIFFLMWSLREKKKLALTFEESQKMLILLLQAQQKVKLGSWKWNFISNEVEWSYETYKRFDKDPKSFVPNSRSLIEMAQPQDRIKIQSAFCDAIKKKGPYYFKCKIKNDTSREWIIETNGHVTFDNQGKALEISGTIQDITEQKKLEEALIKHKEEAIKANQAKSQFITAMSHELRTTLNAILGFSQLLEQEIKEPELKESLTFIKSGGEHLLNLVNEVLDLAKVESGEVNISFENIRLHNFLDEIIGMVKPIAKNQNISLNCKNDINKDLNVTTDNTRLRQVLLNLLSNAIKYNNRGGKVTLKSQVIDDKTIRISVIDNGLGLAQDKQKKIFTPFNRLGAQYSSVEGTGIGLAITKKLVELMNGEIGFTSQESKGSTFWVDLPYKIEKKVIDLTKSEESFEPIDDFNFDCESFDLLYIEDDPVSVALIQGVFKRIKNNNIFVAHTGELGIDIAKDHRPNIILLDISLPGMDGYQVLDRLRISKDTKNIPIIALSASASKLDIEKGLSAGFNSYLTKPFSVKKLLTTIKQVLEPK